MLHTQQQSCTQRRLARKKWWQGPSGAKQGAACMMMHAAAVAKLAAVRMLDRGAWWPHMQLGMPACLPAALAPQAKLCYVAHALQMQAGRNIPRRLKADAGGGVSVLRGLLPIFMWWSK